MNVGDYVQLNKVGHATSIRWTDEIQQFLANNRRLKISYTDVHNHKFYGLNQNFNCTYFEPFKIDYNGPCPFKVGDSVRLRALFSNVDAFVNKTQRDLLMRHGVESFVISNIDAAFLLFGNNWHTGGLVWHRFEYAPEQSKHPADQPHEVLCHKCNQTFKCAGNDVAGPCPNCEQPRKLITDHGYMDARGLGTCYYDSDGDGPCGAAIERHATTRNVRGLMREHDIGIQLKTFAKPVRARPARHETALWGPYAEIDLLCRDSE